MTNSASDGRGDPPRQRAVDWSRELAIHDRWLRTIVAARVRERAAVDEVLQEVRLAALAQRSPLADANRVAPWLYRLAVLQCLMYRRKAGRARKLTSGYAQRAESVEPGEIDPLAWLLADERRAMIREALAELPRRDAEILLLKYTEDWSYREIANRLGVSASAVEARLHRARTRLRTQLALRNVIEAAS